MKRMLTTAIAICLICLLITGCGDAAATESRDDIDVDFTILSSTIATAKFNDIFTDSSEYLGQTIRVSGAYFYIYLAQTDKVYHFVTVVDGDACCRMGFEFRLPGITEFPDDYPDAETIIEVIGVLSIYEELDSPFLYLAVEELNT